jgi:hypothetical protein
MQPIELLPIEIYLSIGKVLHARQQRIAQSHLSHGHGICDGASRPRENGQVRDLKGMAPISQQPINLAAGACRLEPHLFLSCSDLRRPIGIVINVVVRPRACLRLQGGMQWGSCVARAASPGMATPPPDIILSGRSVEMGLFGVRSMTTMPMPV